MKTNLDRVQTSTQGHLVQSILKLGKLSAYWDSSSKTTFSIRSYFKNENKAILQVNFQRRVPDGELADIAMYYMNCLSYGIEPVVAAEIREYSKYNADACPFPKRRIDLNGIYLNGVYVCCISKQLYVCQDVLNQNPIALWAQPIVNLFNIVTNERIGVPIRVFNDQFTYLK